MKVILSEQFEQDGSVYKAGEVVDLQPDVVAERLIMVGRAVPGDSAAADRVATLTANSPTAVVTSDDADLNDKAAKVSERDDPDAEPSDMKVDALKAELKARGQKIPSDAKKDDLVVLLEHRRKDAGDLTIDQLKSDLDDADVSYDAGAKHDDLVFVHRQAYPAPARDHAAASAGGWAPSDYPIDAFPGVVREPMGEGSVGGAFVPSGARLNTGGPLGEVALTRDGELLDGDRASVFPGPSYGDAVAESGAAVNTGGPYGDGTLGAYPGAHRHIDDGVDRADPADVNARISAPNTADDGVPRADLSVLADDLAREHKTRVRAAKGIGTKDFSPVSEEALGVTEATVGGAA